MGYIVDYFWVLRVLFTVLWYWEYIWLHFCTSTYFALFTVPGLYLALLRFLFFFCFFWSIRVPGLFVSLMVGEYCLHFLVTGSIFNSLWVLSIYFLRLLRIFQSLLRKQEYIYSLEIPGIFFNLLRYQEYFWLS